MTQSLGLISAYFPRLGDIIKPIINIEITASAFSLSEKDSVCVMLILSGVIWTKRYMYIK